jgi:hypothetical protein
MRYGDVTEEDQERMSSDEYMVSRDRFSTKLFHAYIQAFLNFLQDYFRIAEQIAQLEDPAGNM